MAITLKQLFFFSTHEDVWSRPPQGHQRGTLLMILIICMCLKEGRALDSSCNGLETLQQILHLTAIHGLRNLKILNFQISYLCSWLEKIRYWITQVIYSGPIVDSVGTFWKYIRLLCCFYVWMCAFLCPWEFWCPYLPFETEDSLLLFPFPPSAIFAVRGEKSTRMSQ